MLFKKAPETRIIHISQYEDEIYMTEEETRTDERKWAGALSAPSAEAYWTYASHPNGDVMIKIIDEALGRAIEATLPGNG